MRTLFAAVLAALQACSVTVTGNDRDSGAAVDTGLPVQGEFVGHEWSTPDQLPWQASTWCADAYADLVSAGNPVCTQTVTLATDGSVLWTHTIFDGDDLAADPLVLPAEPLGSWTDQGPYGDLYAAWKYGVDGRTWIVWPDRASGWNNPNGPRTVLAGGSQLTFLYVP